MTAMKRLMIMRHAEAQESRLGLDDKRRMLTRKGHSDMSRLRTMLLAEGLMPQFAVASDAHRTEITLIEVIGDDFEGHVISSAALYNAEAEKIIETAQSLSDEYKSALIVAHSPGVYQAIMNLANAAGASELETKLGDNYKSGTLTILECPIDKWSDLKLQDNKLAKLFIPD